MGKFFLYWYILVLVLIYLKSGTGNEEKGEKMGYIYSWVKNLVCFYILLTVVLHLLPKENYQKYVRFFSG